MHACVTTLASQLLHKHGEAQVAAKKRKQYTNGRRELCGGVHFFLVFFFISCV